MKTIVTGLTCAGLASAAVAGGIDRSGQPLDVLFKDGNYAELSYAMTNPEVTGDDIAQAPPTFPFPYDSGAEYKGVVGAFPSYGFGIKYDLNDQISLAVIGNEDFGSDTVYPESTGSLLGGTKAIADSYALSFIGRYKFDDTWSVHGGLRIDRSRGRIGLDGLAYGAVAGYEIELDPNIAYGYLVGGAYERPDIALRLAVTYFSEIEHNFSVEETGLPVPSENGKGKTKLKTPQAVNVDFQTGIAPDTLLFASARWADWSRFVIAPEGFSEVTGVDLVKLEDSYTYELGLGHRFNDRLSASVAYSLDLVDGDDLVSPLAPTKGYRALAIGASYRIDQIEIAGGMKYFWLGDAKPETGNDPDVARADFTDNTATTFGIRIGYYF